MTTEKDYVERLEKIIDKQDNLLSQLDSRFDQQDALNEYLFKKNNYLEEDIQKHRDLTRDMNKTVTQQKNVVDKLKKELEDQLKIQQDLHKEYGEVIKQLTDDLEEEQAKNEELTKKQAELEAEIENLKKVNSSKSTSGSDGSVTTTFYDNLNKKAENKSSKSDAKTCPKCGADVKDEYLFCESCGAKL